MNGGSIVNYLSSFAIMLLFICLWGKVKRRIAYDGLNKSIKLIGNRQYRKAVFRLQNIGDELKYETKYWYYLAIALAGAGSTEDAIEAAKKAVSTDPQDIRVKDLLNELLKK